MKKVLLFIFFVSFSTLASFSQTFEKQGAGVTILVHGWNPDGDQPAWMDEMANAIVARNGGVGHIATITVTGTQGNLTATCSDWTFDLANQNHTEIVVLVNWTAVSNHLTTGIAAQEVAAAIAPMIYNGQNGEIPLAALPIHLIGHSRGGGMVFEIARLLGLQGVEVEHVTALDPHPLTAADPQGSNPPIGPGQTIDAPISVYENILFADCYFQNIEYPEGEYITGAYNRLWTSLPGGYHNETGYTYNILGTNYNFSDHLNIILMYHGTIDLTTPTTNGEATMTQTERDAWFNTYENAGENTAYKYSRQIMGNRKSTDIPNSGDAIADGFHNDVLLGGSGARQSLTWTNAVWPNVLETNISQNSSPLSAGVHNIVTGDELDIDFIYRSYANASTVTFYADLDRNPYNTNKTQIGTLELTATGSTIASNSLNWTVADLTVGDTYYIYTKIDNGTEKRFMYAPYEFKLTPVATEPAAGNGTETNPYQIETLENLYWLSQNSTFWNAYFIQTADIDASETETWFAGEGFPPIGTDSEPFTGVYDGNNYTISNLYINRASDYIGLFGYVGDYTLGGSLVNIILENVDITAPSGGDWWFTGALAGNINEGEIDNCHTSGTIQAEYIAGGLAGFIDNSVVSNSSSSCNITGLEDIGGFSGDISFSVVSNCKATGDVSGTSWVAGFAGYNDSEIYNCYATGNVAGENYLGGFVGQLRNASGTPIINNCYAWGNVTRLSGSTGEDIGAFAGKCDDNANSAVEISFSYAIGAVIYEDATNPTDKGFIGTEIGTNTYTANFFDYVTSEQTTGLGATAQITSALQTKTTFTDVGWDFTCETTNGTNDYWGMNGIDNSGYPFLLFQGYVYENESPQITSLHNDQTIGDGVVCEASLPDYTGTVIATDNCDANLDVTQSPTVGTTITGTSNTVTLTVTDDTGNFAEVSFNVEVVDNTNPTITSTHNDQQVDANASCQASLPDYTGNVTVTDNCDANLDVTQSPTAGTTISGISNIVTLTVTDDAENFTEVSFNVEVVDNTNPTISSTHNNQTIDADASCETSLPDYTSDVTATDNCDANLDVIQSPTAGTTISGTSNTVTLTVTDDAGNFAEVSFNVEVVDNINPEITSTHNNQTIDADASCETSLPDYTSDVTATDNCDANLDVIQSPTAGTTISGTSNTVTLTVTDDAGNFAEVSFNVEVVDNINPTISSTHNDQQVDANASCQASLPDYTGDLTATDNCDANLDVTQNPAAGTTISGISNTVTLTVTDDAGNLDEVSFNVEVIDNTNPTVTCPGNQTINLNEGESFYTVQADEFDPTETTDNCGIAEVLNDFNSSSSLENEELTAGTYTITWIVTDNAGNENSCSFELTVNACVGIADLSANDISIYPNPTSGIVTIDFLSSGAQGKVKSFEVTDISGRTIFRKDKACLVSTIDLIAQPAGIYFLKIITEKGIYIEKIIKQ